MDGHGAVALSGTQSFYSVHELAALGLCKVGVGVKLSKKASIYGASRIEIGDFCRIDDFCVLSAGAGGIQLGRNVHVAVFSVLMGRESIFLDDFANISSRVSIYSSSDDFSGQYMTGPTVPDEFTGVYSGAVRVLRASIVGTASVVLPGVTVHEYCAVGACSLVKRDCEPFGMYAGVPAVRTGERKRDLLELERLYLAGTTHASASVHPTAGGTADGAGCA